MGLDKQKTGVFAGQGGNRPDEYGYGDSGLDETESRMTTLEGMGLGRFGGGRKSHVPGAGAGTAAGRWWRHGQNAGVLRCAQNDSAPWVFHRNG